jgi:hypothetical protein
VTGQLTATANRDRQARGYAPRELSPHLQPTPHHRQPRTTHVTGPRRQFSIITWIILGRAQLTLV